MTHVQKILILLTLHFNVAHINISVLNTVPYFLDFRCKKNNNYTCATPVHVTPGPDSNKTECVKSMSNN